MDENLTFFEAPVRPSGTPRRRPVSVLAVNGQFVSVLFLLMVITGMKEGNVLFNDTLSTFYLWLYGIRGYNRVMNIFMRKKRRRKNFLWLTVGDRT